MPESETSRRPLTHATYKLLVQLKRHQGIGQVSQPLLEHARDNVDVVVVQTHVINI